MKKLALITLILLIGIYLLSGIRFLDQEDYYYIFDSRLSAFSPLRLESKVAYAPFPFFKISRYVKKEQSTLMQEWRKPFKSREGAEFFIRGKISYCFDEGKIIQAHSLMEQNNLDPVPSELFYRSLQKTFSSVIMPNPDMKMRWLQLSREAEKTLAHEMTEYGIVLKSFQLDKLFFQSDLEQMPQPLDAKILLIGLDGADWDILNPLMEAGKLPNLKKLVENGSTGRLLTVTPMLSPIIWTSIATGKLPEKHGIMDFLAVDERTGKRIPVTSNLRRASALWNILSRMGLRVGIIGWWASWPAEEVNGYIITERVAYQLFGISSDIHSKEGKAYPADLYPKIIPLIKEPASVEWKGIKKLFNAQATLEHFQGERTELLEKTKTVYASSESFKEIYHYLDDREDVDFQAVYFEGTDTISHLFMPFRRPKMNTVSEEDVKILGNAVDHYHQYIDEVIGGIIQGKYENWTIIVCSDHGFKTGKERPISYSAMIDEGKAAQWHARYGVLIACGKFIKKNVHIKEGRVVDLLPTILTLYGLPVGADMDGRVLKEMILPEFLRDHPIQYVNTYENEVRLAGAETPIESEMDSDIREKLLALGYISENSSNAFNNRGLVFLSKQEYDKAIEEFQKAYDLNPAFTGALINLGTARMQKGEVDGAIQHFNEALDRDPKSIETENLIGNAYMKKGNYQQAEEHFMKALAIEPTFPDALNSLGILYENLGRLEEAIDQYRKVIEIDRYYAEGYNNIGNIWKKKGQAEEAIRWYEKAIEADPFFIGSYNNIALIHQERGDFPKAIQFIEKALEKAPANAFVMNNLGSLYFSQGDLEAAIEMWRKSIEILPSYESPYNNLGAAYGKKGMLDKEIEMYKKALQLNPDYIDARFNLGLAHIRGDELARGMEELHMLAEKNPDLVKVWIFMVKTHFKNKDYGEGMKILQEALEKNTSNISLLNMAGEAYLLMKDKEEALKYFKQSLLVNPDQEIIKRQIKELSRR
jgi:tetratricopeptide (TPR) repeat protein/predicted AlkP superfamily phosphohydrolase/phosphomutase